MRSILAITSSLNGAVSNSNKLVAQYLANRQSTGAVRVTERDLHADQLPHLSAEEMQAWNTSAAQRSEEQTQLATFSDTLIDELKNADEVVLGVPMYNFGIPSVLKAWIDRVARAGVTFAYTDTGPVGLLADKPVTVLAARGGQYAGTEMDTQTAYLTHFFNFIGLSDLRFVYAEGLAMDPEKQQHTLSVAEQKIIELSTAPVD
ncbi:NAD(P)H-dependent oxidoreductase [Alteromonas sp. ASW11-19]|uniref:FMN dependent NADH:quinone oxidoreductase n=1 Tax=Alteromonas salexigens TaxID=2982530 RepID=A0ABT2VLS3_9ALTE|nr:NAD(P)H-dependent oxidoreductase [Alteromonas salexigens]MCU7554025.1 NAD(P)H-dependent oxidoreductase [Alteromonas salexigens]